MAFYGDLDDFPLHDILFLLASHGKSGRLTLFTSTDEITMVLDRGRIASVSGSDESLRLGRLLVSQGVISEDQLDQALALQEVTDSRIRIGDLLVELGFVEPAQIARAVAAQFEASLFRVLIQSGGTFSFTPGDVEAADPLMGDVPIEPIVLNAVRLADEWLAVHAADERVQLVDQVIDTARIERMNEAEKRVLMAVMDGASSRHDLARSTGLPSDTLRSAVSTLVEAGLVVRTVGADSANGSYPDARPAREDR